MKARTHHRKQTVAVFAAIIAVVTVACTTSPGSRTPRSGSSRTGTSKSPSQGWSRSNPRATTTTTTPSASTTTPDGSSPSSTAPPATQPTTTRPPTTTPATTPSTTVAPSTGGTWRPSSATPLALHWVLGDTLDLNDPVAMGLRDLQGNALPAPDVYDIDGQLNTAGTVAALHALGKKVICYFDAGVYETYRPDAGLFPASIIGNPDEGWDGSYWLDIRQISVLEPIMRARIADCKAKGFDSVEPDEIDGYSNDSGFPLTYADQLAYNRALSTWAHQAGISIGQKGDIDQIGDLVAYFDWTLNEECGRYDECTSGGGGLQQYSDSGKAVWIAEYRPEDLDCAALSPRHWNAALYELGLPIDGGRTPCPGW